MDYAAEDSQNAAPGSAQAAKLNASRKGPDSHSVTKRYAI
jgi:ubiquitin-conjugating enzyme E2 C